MIGEITDNQLILNSLICSIYRQNEKELDFTKSNVNKKGGIDFTKFFAPLYNLRIVSDEISFNFHLDIDGKVN